MIFISYYHNQIIFIEKIIFIINTFLYHFFDHPINLVFTKYMKKHQNNHKYIKLAANSGLINDKNGNISNPV